MQDPNFRRIEAMLFQVSCHDAYTTFIDQLPEVLEKDTLLDWLESNKDMYDALLHPIIDPEKMSFAFSNLYDALQRVKFHVDRAKIYREVNQMIRNKANLQESDWLRWAIRTEDLYDVTKSIQDFYEGIEENEPVEIYNSLGLDLYIRQKDVAEYVEFDRNYYAYWWNIFDQYYIPEEPFNMRPLEFYLDLKGGLTP